MITAATDVSDRPRDAHGRWLSTGAHEHSPASRATQKAAASYRAGAASVAGVAPDLQARAEAVSAALGGRVDLTGMSHANQAGVVNALERFNGRYPAVSVGVQALDSTSITGARFFGGAENRDTIAVTIPGDDLRQSTIYLNNNYFASTAALTDAVRSSVAQGFMSHGPLDPADHAVTHELGHSLSIHLGMAEAGVHGQLADTPFGRAMAKIEADRTLFTAQNVAGVSRYSMQSLPEFVAEAFTNTDQPNRLALEVQTVLDQAYGEMHGGRP